MKRSPPVAAAALITAAALTLSACQTTSGGPELPLGSLFIDDGSGPVPYVAALGGVSEPRFGDKGLPLPVFGIHVAALPKPAHWMRAYNFDGNNELSRAEMTQAWLVKTAEWKTGRAYAPTSLSAPAPTASIQLAQTPLVSLQGLNISVEDEKSVRGVIDDITGGAAAAQAKQATAAQKAITDMMTSVNRSFASTSSGGGDGGGGESSGGSDGGSSGTSGGGNSSGAGSGGSGSL